MGATFSERQRLDTKRQPLNDSVDLRYIFTTESVNFREQLTEFNTQSPKLFNYVCDILRIWESKVRRIHANSEEKFGVVSDWAELFSDILDSFSHYYEVDKNEIKTVQHILYYLRAVIGGHLEYLDVVFLFQKRLQSKITLERQKRDNKIDEDIALIENFLYKSKSKMEFLLKFLLPTIEAGPVTIENITANCFGEELTRSYIQVLTSQVRKFLEKLHIDLKLHNHYTVVAKDDSLQLVKVEEF